MKILRGALILGMASTAWASTPLVSLTIYGPPSPDSQKMECGIYRDHIDRVTSVGETVISSVVSEHIAYTDEVTTTTLPTLIASAVASPIQIDSTLPPPGCGEISYEAQGVPLSSTCGGVVRETNIGPATQPLIDFIHLNCTTKTD